MQIIRSPTAITICCIYTENTVSILTSSELTAPSSKFNFAARKLENERLSAGDKATWENDYFDFCWTVDRGKVLYVSMAPKISIIQSLFFDGTELFTSDIRLGVKGPFLSLGICFFNNFLLCLLLDLTDHPGVCG